MIATESPKDGFDEIIFERFVDELKIKHPKNENQTVNIDITCESN